MPDFDEMMDEYECPNCSENGWACDCTPEELAELEAMMQEDKF